TRQKLEEQKGSSSMGRMIMRTNRVVGAFVFILALAAAVVAQTAKPSLDQAIDSLYSVRGFEQVTISPDGSQVAWVQRLSSGGSGIFIQAIGALASQPKRLSASTDQQPHDEGHVA